MSGLVFRLCCLGQTYLTCCLLEGSESSLPDLKMAPKECVESGNTFGQLK